jgi:hypothetical protein
MYRPDFTATERSNMMQEESDWIASTIAKTRRQSAAVPDAVNTKVESLLRGKLGQRPMPAMELSNVAKDLIELLIPAPPNPEEQK